MCLAIAANYSPTLDSRLLAVEFPEYKNTVLQEGGLEPKGPDNIAGNLAHTVVEENAFIP